MIEAFSWLKERGVHWTLKFSGLDAGGDRCKRCGIVRRNHDGKDHRFMEDRK